MGKILTVILSAVTAIMVTLMAGCNTAGCIDNQSSIPLAGFYSMSTLKSISVDSLTIGGIGAPNDSLLIDNATVSQVTLPFRAATSTTAFFIHYNHKALSNSRLNDTITFNYDAYPYFASEECGAMYQYHITKVAYTKHLIDSIGIVDSVISNVDLERIHIFMRTATTSSNVRAKL